MKTSYLLNILLALALVILSVKITFFDKPAADDSSTDTSSVKSADENTVIENILTRSSVRAYSDRTVTDSQIDTLMRAAMAAPTAVNKQPWQFIVIKDRAILDSIAAGFPNIKMAAKARIAVVVCGDLSKALEGDGQAYWIQDCSAATENLLLAAHGMGLGAVWCGIYPITERVEAVRSLLGIPQHLIPLNIIPVGYPAGDSHPKDKYDAARIHYDRF